MEDDEVQVPGTLYLVDLESKSGLKHATGEHKEIVLVPTPSSDPDDPLNWSTSRKTLSTACMCVYTLMVSLAGAAIYSVLEPISDATGLTLSDLNAGTGYTFLLAGWGCLVWQPLALQYGKRPVYLFSLLAILATQLWAPYARSSGQWIASKIVQGFIAAPIEALCEISVTDVYYQHERGAYIGLYALVLAGGNFFAPIIAGWIAQGHGWEWVFYWTAIFCGVGFVFLLFFMEETNYSRRVQAEQHEEAEGNRVVGGIAVVGSLAEHEQTEHRVAEEEEEEKVRDRLGNPDKRRDEIGEKARRKTPPPPATVAVHPSQELPKTYLTKLKFFCPHDLRQPNQLLGMATRPLVLLAFPVIVYAGFSYGSAVVWFNVLNGTTSLILGGTYHFSAGLVGTTYASPLVGVALGALYTGPLGDRFVLRMARRNGGTAEPEHRLWLFAVSLVLLPLGLLLWGVGAARGLHWSALVVAMGLIALTNTIGLQLSVSYCIDSYRDLGAEAVVAVILVRNTMSFAASYGLTDWVRNMGLQNAFVVAAVVGVAECASFLVFVRYGKALRRRSAARYAKYVRETARSRMIH